MFWPRQKASRAPGPVGAIRGPTSDVSVTIRGILGISLGLDSSFNAAEYADAAA